MIKCPSCSKTFSTKGKRQKHHKNHHGKPIPNCTCNFCGEKFYHKKANRKRCSKCPSNIHPPPKDFNGSPKDWEELTSQQRYYFKNSEKHKKSQRRKEEELKKWLQNYKSDRKCKKCDYDNPVALEFHHEKPEQKYKSIGRMVSDGYSKERILDEIKKCMLICRNCHSKEHTSKRNKVKANENRDSNRKLRNWFKEYKRNQSCEQCGEKDHRVLEFHHNDNDKEGTVSKMIANNSIGSKNKIIKEINKCKILCGNCHRIEEYGNN